MAIIALRAWYIEEYEPIREIIKRPHDLRLSRNSLLKSGLRVDFLDESQDVQSSNWFQRYLEGETVEFYVEGSGSYIVSNVDLVSHEIYFTKQETSAWLDPIIYYCYQSEYAPAHEALQTALEQALNKLNKKSRLALSLETSIRPREAPMRLSSTQLRQIRKCLLFIADGTPITQITDEKTTQLLLPSPNTCIEIGYALQAKRSGQILLVQMQRPDLSGKYPFDLPNHQQLSFKTATEVSKVLPRVLETLLQRFNLWR